MTLIELQAVLGNQINLIMSSGDNRFEHNKALENAEYVAKLAKQMINNADVILRTDKMCGTKDRINRVTGE